MISSNLELGFINLTDLVFSSNNLVKLTGNVSSIKISDSLGLYFVLLGQSEISGWPFFLGTI